MSDYPFQLVRYDTREPLADKTLLAERPFTRLDRSFRADSRRFVPGDELETAINTAIAVGEPLLITGEPGTGKTQAAYYAAYKLGVEPVIHFQVKSDSTARDMLYHFDTVRYFHDAHLQSVDVLDKQKYIEPRALWEAFTRATGQNAPCILLIDEIDKAPRDFPNDLLLELDKMEFKILEVQDEDGNATVVKAPDHLAPIVFITSNSERRLPEPFLRRCVYHHIKFDNNLVRQAVSTRQDEFGALSKELVDLAVRRFLALRDRNLRKLPATGELLVWLRVLALAVGANAQQLERQLNDDLSELPYPGVLLKDHQDIEELRGGSRY